tara:strand:+ start:365 stop:553 length:189 start_codon:yes stop_codon:yes gene_type:complete
MFSGLRSFFYSFQDWRNNDFEMSPFLPVLFGKKVMMPVRYESTSPIMVNLLIVMVPGNWSLK